ncbi:TRAP transporter permease [Anoxybacillus sp. LAT_35]|uniref:TRAP transporter permease n=1 Tax=Anoxybacillus TaxID=150247 RepID=UPI001EDA451B|nr:MULTISPECIES: TRAP transporter permease [Anoxybacillus]MCG5026721.1 TRAP transporter permease [Anoxybacillus flavithermus]MCG6196401.1 TRAP transporter permease [Anoxybacillus sp. LAT_38]MCG3083165.1 TRAP transporter permease [Anoxybacillus sp. LAT27]MCG3083887.1 TRAP transporter permease [Anoxybacillus sp. LAT27]MCG3085402.1 TRAP transporter permease [Anoxybacillus sp. LAT27]
MDKEKFETLSAEEQQQILEKYDPESNTRKLTGVFQKVTFVGLLAFSLFQLYTAIFGVFTAQIQRSIHLGFALALIFLLFPARRGKRERGKLQIAWYDIVLALLSIYVGAYWPMHIDEIVMRAGLLTDWDFYVGVMAIVLVLEATRRAVGLPIMIIAILFLSYGYFGEMMPNFLRHSGLSLQRLVQTMFFTTEGILGTPLGVSSTFIFLFLLFGSFLVKTGVGQYFNDLAVAIAGRSTGGPAKVAIFSSALQGTISGSSVANVVTSGSFTIPMMKKLGYKKEFAGAVEAAASTGGQLMPPIMGAAAFLMVEFIGGGLTYWDIAKAATIPALLYFAGIWIMTHFEAKRIGLSGLSKEEMPDRKEVLKKIYLLVPIVSVIALLMAGVTVTHAALYSIVIAIVVGFLNRASKMKPVDLIYALVDGARTALGVAAATASAGIIVGIVTKTGLGLKLANGLLDIAGGQLLPTLFLTMIAAIVLGMGSPTTANYVITSTIAAPAIILLGVPDLSAHLFVFYFGIIADITPPVALAAFAAAGVSGGEPIRTGIQSAKLAIAAFIIPYMFVLSPQLLMINTTTTELLWVIFTAVTGMIAIGAGMIGYWLRSLHWVERILSVTAGVMLINPTFWSDVIGLGSFAILLVLQFIWKRDAHQHTKGK